MTSETMLPEVARVGRIHRETHDTFSIRVDDIGAESSGFRPGQFNMLYAFGVGEAPISISGGPSRPDRLWHTIRAVGPVTRALGALRRGDELGVRGPFGSTWPLERATGRDVVIVAGGIGLAPLRPVIYSILANRRKFGRVGVVYGARTRGDLLYQSELERWRSRLEGNLEITVDRGDGAWHGATGVVTKLLSRIRFEPERAVALTCGPEVMMRFASRELVRMGVSESDIYLSLERSMKCATATCGHCMLGANFVCKDGPVFRYRRVASLLAVREL